MRVLSVALAGLICVGTTVVTAAQTADSTSKAWRVECTGDGKVLDCRAVQQLFEMKTKQLILSIIVRQPHDSKSANMVIQLPLGINLTEPMLLRVDNGPPEKQPVQTCTNLGCLGSMTIPDKFLAAMRIGHDLKIAFQDSNKQSIELMVPLLGFSLAFDKAR
jgi:invasion protein IalB